MCIFNKAVDGVSGTKILVASTTDNRQLTVYTNTIAFGSSAKSRAASGSSSSASKPGNAMILPCPFAGEGKIELVDLSSLPKLFKKANAAFPTEALLSRGSPSSSSRSAGSKAFLAVHQVGSYSVSIAETLDDLKRIDPSVFKLEDNIAEVLGAHYSKGFGFVVCKFNEGKKMHPIAFIHPRAADQSQLFVPTRHEHGHDGPSEPDWDHEIFSLSCTSKAGPTPKEFEATLGVANAGNIRGFVDDFLLLRKLVPSLPSKFVLRRQVIEGEHENTDLIFDILPSFLGSTPDLADADEFIKLHAGESVVAELQAKATEDAKGNEKGCLLQ